MSNLHDARPKVKTITLNDGVEREIKFTLNAMAELEDKYGSVEAAFQQLDSGSIKAARFILWAALVDANPDLTEKQVGSLIDMDCLNNIMEAMNDALSDDTVSGDGNGASLPNA